MTHRSDYDADSLEPFAVAHDQAAYEFSSSASSEADSARLAAFKKGFCAGWDSGYDEGYLKADYENRPKPAPIASPHPIEVASISIGAIELSELKNRAGELALSRIADAFEASGISSIPLSAIRAAAGLIGNGGKSDAPR